MTHSVIVVDGVVINRIVATAAEAEVAYPAATCIEVEESAPVGIGWMWDGDEFAPPTPSLSEAKAAKKAAAEAEYETRRAAGYPVPDTDETLQLRTELDRTNWLALKDACNDAIMAGAGSEPCALPIRTTSNASLAMTWAEAADLMRGLRAWGAAMMAQLWALKDAIEAAEDQTALDAIDVASGWPS